MLEKLSADAMRANFFALHLPKTKGAEPELRAFVFDRRCGWAGLSDDLGSLRDDRDSDRSKQGEGGGDRSNLGHFVSLSVFSVC